MRSRWELVGGRAEGKQGKEDKEEYMREAEWGKEQEQIGKGLTGTPPHNLSLSLLNTL